MTLNDIRNQLAERLDSLEDIANRINMSVIKKDFLIDIINKTTFDIVVVGEFTSGKSTLINAMLGIELLPALLEPTTARITYISYSDNPKIVLKMKSGEIITKSYDEKYLQSLVAENKTVVENIDYIEVFIDSPLLRDGVRLIDTPGTNDTDEQRVSVTYGLIPKADAVIYLTIHPVTSSNVQVFREYIFSNKINNIYFVLNKIDLLGDQYELASKDVFKWFENEYKGPIEHFYSLSALDYLEAINNGNDELIQKSKFNEFSDSFTKFLRGSDKYKNLEAQYAAIFDNLKNQMIELIKVKIGGLSIPEESFNERNKALQEDLREFNEQVKELKKQIDGEINLLVLKIEESLSDLLPETLSVTDDILTNKRGDMDLIIKDIELAVKYKYEAWREGNEPIINKILNSMREEISIRVMVSIQKMNSAVIKFSGITLNANVQEIGSSPLTQIFQDDVKSQFVSTAAVVGGMFILSGVGIFPPLAFLIGPLVSSYRKKTLDSQKEQKKPQIITALQESFQAFRKQIIGNIKTQHSKLVQDINSGIIEQSARINAQLDEIEKERHNKQSEIEQIIVEYKKALIEIKGI